jgi:adenylate kinase
MKGTYTDHYRTDKPKGVKKILKRYKPKLSRKLMLEKNDVWIYDLHNGDPKDIKFAVDCLNSIPALEE